MNRDLGAATAVITHNADIAGMADRVAHVDLNANRRNPRELHLKEGDLVILHPDETVSDGKSISTGR